MKIAIFYSQFTITKKPITKNFTFYEVYVFL